MCIVIFKSHKAKAPTDKIIEQCWDNNPDGAGVMVLRPKDTFVEYHKGCMDLKEFKYVLASLNIKDDDFVAYHFRIATSGGVTKAMTHPFPSTAKIAALKSLSGRSKRTFMHNGVFGPGKDDLSDTALFVKHKLSKIDSLLKHQQDIATETLGSRTITFDAREGILSTGDWIEDSGLCYSNSTYKETYYSRTWKYDESNWGLYRAKTNATKGSYYDGYAKYCKISDEQETWSDEAYEFCGCGYGHRSRTYCGGCEFQEICERGVLARQTGFIPETCHDFIPWSDRTTEVCNSCSLRHTCTERVIPVPRKQRQWIDGKGYCIAVY